MTIKRLVDENLGIYGCFDQEDNLIKEFEVALVFRCVISWLAGW